MRLFLYGTALDPRILARRSGDPALPQRCQHAVLRGWRRVTLAHTRWPTLRRCAKAATAGKIVIAGAAALRRLAAYEGPEYRLQRLCIDRRTPVWAWIARGGTQQQSV
jgi:Gamma-glutamyl cyclotransferase, AIG2-like